MTYEEYLATSVAPLQPVPADEPEGFCGHCGLLCRFTEEPYTGAKVSTCCHAAPFKPHLLRDV